MEAARILVVDDDEMILLTLSAILSINKFRVTTASTVAEALRQISSNEFDVLLSDLHMPAVGDGLTVVSAMRHANPTAVTLLLSAFPAMHAAAHAIVLQADDVLVKPLNTGDLVDCIRKRLASGPHPVRPVESPAALLDRMTESTIDNWYQRVEEIADIAAVPLTREQRCAHLPQLLRDIVDRLEAAKLLTERSPASDQAARHGCLRRQQGYTPSMIMEESRELQASIFQTLQDNLACLDFTSLLAGVMTIADEIDSQLIQSIRCHSAAHSLARAS